MSFRIQRIQSLIQHEVGEIVTKDLRDPRLARVTITGVTVSHDIRNASIYYSVLGDETDIANAKVAFEKAKSYIRHEIGHRIELKFTPDLHFAFDESIEHAAHINELLIKSKQQMEKNESDTENS